MNTHVHADHVTGTGVLKGMIPECRSVIAKSSGARADILVEPGSSVVFGRHSLEVRPTPGHTNGKFLKFIILFFRWQKKIIPSLLLAYLKQFHPLH